VKALNARGINNVIAVDILTQGDRFANLVDCEIDIISTKTNHCSVEQSIFNAPYCCAASGRVFGYH